MGIGAACTRMIAHQLTGSCLRTVPHITCRGSQFGTDPNSVVETRTMSLGRGGDDPGDDSDDHSGDDSDDDGQLVSHLYTFMCQIDHRVSLVTPASPFLE